MTNRWIMALLALGLVSGCSGTGRSASSSASASKADAVCDIAPDAPRQPQRETSTQWSGTWTDHRRENYGGDLHCEAEKVGDNRWEARFFGHCGYDYSYEVELIGEKDGAAVRFSGEVDLGEAGGGVYNWVGHMLGQEFAGEYTTARGKAGSFHMTRRP